MLSLKVDEIVLANDRVGFKKKCQDYVEKHFVKHIVQVVV